MKELTKAEEQVMQIIWKLKKSLVRDIIDNFPDPKPAYTTVSTLIRILENKGFVDHKAYGKTHEYFPIISKKDYTKSFMGNFVKNYFSNSYNNMVSFFAKDTEMSVEEIEGIMEILNDKLKNKKSIQK